MQLQQPVTESLCADSPTDSLFERYGWFYALCREHLFHDHSNRIARAFWADAQPPAGTHLLELGCGPGFYACRFAERSPQIRTTGVDLSQKLLSRARQRAEQKNLTNCSFQLGDVYSLPDSVSGVDAIVVSRLFLIVPHREQILREIFRVLRPGGKCFIAEPVAGLRTQFPLSMMWLLAKLTSFARVPFVEPDKVRTISVAEFHDLLGTQPWESIVEMHDARYQIAVCQKPMTETAPTEQAIA